MASLDSRHSTTASYSASSLIKLEEVDEGEHVETTDYYFEKIGEPVPVKQHGPIFDSESPPAQPLAVSERFRLIFIAHLSGFCMARIKDVIATAKEIKVGGSGSSVQDLSIVDVPVGKVHILALSTDNSTLAAAVANDIYLFSVSSLLEKAPKPSSPCSLNDSSCIKDFKWTRKLENSYLVLSKHGQLYQGLADGPLKNVMHEVDAVEWSVKGKFIAVAKKDILSIFSCKFKERLSMSLLLNSGNGNTDTNFIVKVDCIKWVRADCIIIGCFQSSAEENYVVQVIRSNNGKITDASSNRVVLSFHDMHPGFTHDIMPVDSGPCLLLSYLDKCKLAIVANRNNTDQHIVLLGWLLGDENEAAVIDIERDTLLPRIELQENGDDNLVMGLCIDRISRSEKVKVQTGVEEMREVSPYCVLLCLTLEGKLIMFNFSGVKETEVPAEIVSSCDDEEEDTSLLPIDYDQSQLSSESGKEFGEVSVGLRIQDMNKIAISSGILTEKTPISNDVKPFNIDESPASNMDGSAMSGRERNIKSWKVDPLIGSQSLKSSSLEKPSNETEDFGKPVQEFTSLGSSAVAFVGSSADVPSQSFHIVKEPMKRLMSTGLQDASELSSDKTKLLNKLDPISSFLPSNSLESSKSENLATGNASAGFFGKSFQTKDAAGTLTQSGRQIISGAGKIESLPVIHSAHISLQDNFTWGRSSNEKHNRPERNYSNVHQAKPISSEQNLLKQFANMKEMSKELDMLLKSIEEPGGFWDTCNSFQKSSVEELELGLANLSDQCQLWRRIMNERVQEIQSLFDKTVQVLAKKIYVQGLVKQASDSRYWELWDRQKLSSELELKQQRILKLNQDMTNQLIELERHFNGLELNKFGANGESLVSERSLQSKFGSSSRHNHSVHSLNNIMGSQLAAAQLLSECLSKQMAALNIESPSLKRPGVTKELFETIGITYDASFSSPNVSKITDKTSTKKLLLSADSFSSKDASRRKQWSGMKNYETETGRRRRDSLDRNLASFDPPKTTVKRMLLQGSQKTSEHISLLDKKNFLSGTAEGPAVARPDNSITSSMFFSSSSKNPAAITKPEKGSENPATPFMWANLPQPSSTSGQKFQALQKNNVTASSPLPVYQSSHEMQKKSNAPLEKSHAEVTYSEKSNSFDYLSVTRTDSPQKSDINLDQKSSISTMFSTQLPTLRKSVDASNLNSKKTANVKDRHATVSPHLESGNKPEAVFVGIGTENPLVPNFYGTGKTEEKTSPTTYSPSLPFVNSSLNTSSIASTLISGIAVSKSLASSAAVSDSNKALSTSTTQSNFSPPVISVSDSLFQAPKIVSPTPTLSSLNPTFESPKKELPISKSVADTEEQAPASQPDSIELKLQPSVTSADNNHVEPISGIQTRSKDVKCHAPNVTGDDQQKQSPAAYVPLPTPNLIPSKIAANDKNETSDVVIPQDDNMDEEAPEMNSTIEFSLSSLGGFGDGSPPSAPKPNPFGGSFGSVNVISNNPSFATAAPSGELFRPASFSFQSPLASQASQPTNSVAFSGGFSSGMATQASSQSGFGQRAQIGQGQQALGTVLGAFGQSRQLGPSLPGTSSGSPGGFGGGFTGMQPVGDGGFSSAATGGGFAGVGSGSGGGFAGVASAGGGFAGTGGGLPAAGGGFGAFSSQQASGFSGFGAGGTGKPPELFTQMRK